MKHKLFALILLIMALCLAACGGKDAADPAQSPTTQPTTGNSDPSQETEGTTAELPAVEEPTWPEIEFDWEPAAPSGSFHTTEPTTEEPAPEQPGGENTGNTDKTEQPTEQPTEEETSPAERDGVTGNYTPWG